MKFEPGGDAWVGVLKKAGFPTDVVVVDFETYWDGGYTLSSMSTIEYVMDDRFEILGTAILRMKGKAPFAPLQPMCWRGDYDGIWEQVKHEYGPNLERCTVVVANRRFDPLVMAKRLGITPKYVIDIQDLSRQICTHRSHRVKHLAEFYDLDTQKGDTAAAVPKGLRLSPRWIRQPGRPPQILQRAMTDDEFNRMAEYARDDAVIEWQVFTILMPQLSRPEVELPLQNHTTQLFLKPQFQIDPDKATEILDEMEATFQAEIEPSGLTIKQLNSMKFAEMLRDALPPECRTDPELLNRTKPTKSRPNGTLRACLAKDDPGRERLLSFPDERVQALAKARVAVKSWPNHMKRVHSLVRQAEVAGGLHVPIVYHGAHTGRWSGTEKINLQNLSSRSQHEVLNAIRHLLVAPEGKTLVVVDLSSIEAVVLAWVAGELPLLEMFRAGGDPYIELATRMFAKEIRKPLKTDIPPVRQFMKMARACGKVGVLGGGYGMGPEKAMGYAQGFGLDLDLGESEKLIKTYRSGVPKITAFWGHIEQRFGFVTRYKKETTWERPTPDGPVPCLTFRVDPDYDDCVQIVLPSGRALRYYEPRKNNKGQLTIRGQTGKTHIWGGHLTENVVQAMARDILAEAILATEDAGWPIGLHVHDEEVGVVDEADGEEALADIIEIMRTPPAWAPDIPLGAEGQVTKRYCK